MERHPYIGMGENPHGPDLPMGFGMHLMQEPKAMDNYDTLTIPEQESVIRYIKGGSTGEEAERRVMNAVKMLAEGKKNFF